MSVPTKTPVQAPYAPDPLIPQIQTAGKKVIATIRDLSASALKATVKYAKSLSRQGRADVANHVLMQGFAITAGALAHPAVALAGTVANVATCLLFKPKKSKLQISRMPVKLKETVSPKRLAFAFATFAACWTTALGGTHLLQKIHDYNLNKAAVASARSTMYAGGTLQNGDLIDPTTKTVIAKNIHITATGKRGSTYGILTYEIPNSGSESWLTNRKRANCTDTIPFSYDDLNNVELGNNNTIMSINFKPQEPEKVTLIHFNYAPQRKTISHRVGPADPAWRHHL
ncbi:MAG: hypothetical protein AB7E52_01780 [Bdellovibrionales bacterium]